MVAEGAKALNVPLTSSISLSIKSTGASLKVNVTVADVFSTVNPSPGVALKLTVGTVLSRVKLNKEELIALPAVSVSVTTTVCTPSEVGAE